MIVFNFATCHIYASVGDPLLVNRVMLPRDSEYEITEGFVAYVKVFFNDFVWEMKTRWISGFSSSSQVLKSLLTVKEMKKLVKGAGLRLAVCRGLSIAGGFD